MKVTDVFCTVEIIAGTAQEAEALATKAFTEFFGTEEFRISEKTSESDVVLMNGTVASYKCKFSARLGSTS